MTINKIRISTDNPERFTPLRVCTTPEEARQAALSSVSVTCLDCNTTFPGDHVNMPQHRCRDSRGRDLGPMKQARAAGARRELLALKNYPAPPCANCGAAMPPGVMHTCSVAHEPMPHERVASQWQRQGAAAALAAELEEIKGDR